jgi:hypothetical protein
MIPSSHPAISILMAVHNGEKFLREALDSMLGQTFADFEFIIIDDGSTDGSRQILQEYQSRDARIRVITQANQGLPASLNRALQEARAPLVARMDADDISLPDRLQLQFTHMQQNPDTTVLGTWFVGMDEAGRPTREYELPTTSWMIEWEMCRRCVLGHPTVMARRDVLKGLGGYDNQLRYGQDYDLWLRVLRAGGSLANLPVKLLRYRESAQSASVSKKREQDAIAMRSCMQHLEWLLERKVENDAVASMRHMIGNPLGGELASVGSGLSLVKAVNAAFKRKLSKERAAHVSRLTAVGVMNSLWRREPADRREALKFACTICSLWPGVLLTSHGFDLLRLIVRGRRGNSMATPMPA